MKPLSIKPLILRRPVIAVTGSAGKSTAKEMLASILGTRWKILKSVGNMNFYNHTMRYRRMVTPAHKALVLEYGMSGAGHIRRHCQIIRPNMAIITNIGTAHLGAFGGSVKRLAAAKSELIQHMDKTGTLVTNADDANSKLLNRQGFTGKQLTVGMKQPADYRATNVRYTTGGMVFRVLLHGQEESFFIPIYGVHQVYNALNAIAIADQLGFSPANMRLGLRRYHRMSRRLTVHRLGYGIHVIDDSYSANPNAAKAAIDVLTNIGKGRTIAVFASMLALGPYSVRGHREVGKYVAKHGVYRLYTYGALAKHIEAAAVQAGMRADRVHHFTSRTALHRHLWKHLERNCTVLVKGSHAMDMKETVEWLRRKLGKR
ncbi:MAG: UDP-N-acetylmuramoyl-tripeptide--D-alanyl-D-alanine ligase [Alicyclobacillus sp.]|nr:UDP-N-acetylmuramoyl-tripeptide--D-alanyl-D-alanine ligase [Alicyclobacillus sp.]